MPTYKCENNPPPYLLDPREQGMLTVMGDF
ncbi:hypothetical protein PIIN_11628 [Serendipita indica DSM 11827]|uniref:Uncharacterized protein n=1 Tax=Serendipita indica (strain DSM 11827) TaxID=1109443 RepID=G4U257_SERID|nr:hypothetical protein PIIN_11628 [Serendipita indica DSM 11827]